MSCIVFGMLCEVIVFGGVDEIVLFVDMSCCVMVCLVMMGDCV